MTNKGVNKERIPYILNELKGVKSRNFSAAIICNDDQEKSMIYEELVNGLQHKEYVNTQYFDSSNINKLELIGIAMGQFIAVDADALVGASSNLLWSYNGLLKSYKSHQIDLITFMTDITLLNSKHDIIFD